MASPAGSPYPPIGDYALIGDCHAAALVSSAGGIDWCCLPRFDSASVFGRLLDWKRGGVYAVAPDGPARATRRYLDGTLVLETTFETDGGRIRLTDCFAMRRGGREEPRRQLIRVVEGVGGEVPIVVRIAPRFDYGQTAPWVRPCANGLFTAVGSSNGLAIWSDLPLALDGDHDVACRVVLRAGDRRHLSLYFVPPEKIDESRATNAKSVAAHLEETIRWWHAWTSKAGDGVPAEAMRSAIVLKAMTHAPTGGIIAAPTTSLPEAMGAARNWDYRFAWIRDSTFAVRSLAAVGFTAEADGFARFVERSAAGSADALQVLYGVGGERMLPEIELRHLDGYRGSRPVRVGNAATEQLQLDIYGELADLAWEWHTRARTPHPDYLRFLRAIVEETARRWRTPDRGIWEVRGEPQHFVHSKVLCWVALDRGVRLACDCGIEAPIEAWNRTRDEIREAIERDGYDAARGIFVRAFGSRAVDAALLLLPQFGFVAWDDPRMVRTATAVRDELAEDGLVRRYRADDGLESTEGAFVACTFWLAECLARQGRREEAQATYDRGRATANDLGLFAEEFDVGRGEMLGNFPQGLTHLSHLQAVTALAGIPTDARPIP